MAVTAAVSPHRVAPVSESGVGKPRSKPMGLAAARLDPPAKKAAISPNPSSPPQELERQAVALLQQGKLREAEEIYRGLIAAGIRKAAIYGNLGAICGQTDRIEECVELLQRSIEIDPKNPDSYGNLGNILKEKGDLDGAIASCKTALQLKPNYPEAHYNLGVALQEQGDLDGAIASYKTALQLRPNHSEAHCNLSLTLLLGGDYIDGWEKYEWRFKTQKDSLPHACPKCRQWDGTALAPHDPLLLVSEQGLGDTLQFIRYALYLKYQGFSVSCCAPPKLHGLIQASGIDSSPLTPSQAKRVSDGQWLPLLSLPRHLQVSPENPLFTEPYIQTTEALMAKWRSVLELEQRPIIGINWRGNRSDRKKSDRNVPIESLESIVNGVEASFLSLQRGFGEGDSMPCWLERRLIGAQPEIHEIADSDSSEGFLEYAAIIANCDLVITTGTTVAHLAAGMGKPTWVLLQKVPEWRWGLEGDTSFWYPSMRLFRQRERGNWTEVMQRVAEALQQHFAGCVIDQAAAVAPLAAQAMPLLQVPVSLGELLDKITILQLKREHLSGENLAGEAVKQETVAREACAGKEFAGKALANVSRELEALEATLSHLNLNLDPQLLQRLKDVNRDLWNIEDQIRAKEQQKDFGEVFIRLARSVYQQNDRRAAIKKEINTLYGSALVEEKCYANY